MWVEIRKARNLVVAETWRELFENQGVPCKLWPIDSESHGVAFTTYQILVPNDRVRVARMVVDHTF
jgi:hypothetical protein